MQLAAGDTSGDDWETDEEIDVVVKLSGVIRDEFIKNIHNSGENLKASSLGLMNEEPLIQIGNDLFKGKYGHPSGTHLLLKVTPDQDNKSTVSYVCTSDKQLMMNKLYIQEKQAAVSISDDIEKDVEESSSQQSQTEANSSMESAEPMDTTTSQTDRVPDEVTPSSSGAADTQSAADNSLTTSEVTVSETKTATSVPDDSVK